VSKESGEFEPGPQFSLSSAEKRILAAMAVLIGVAAVMAEARGDRTEAKFCLCAGPAALAALAYFLAAFPQNKSFK